MARALQQLGEAFPEDSVPRYLILDRDRKYEGEATEMFGSPAASRFLSVSDGWPSGVKKAEREGIIGILLNVLFWDLSSLADSQASGPEKAWAGHRSLAGRAEPVASESDPGGGLPTVVT